MSARKPLDEAARGASRGGGDLDAFVYIRVIYTHVGVA
jgi:hypothetical protein